jgi:hypothetical protein
MVTPKLIIGTTVWPLLVCREYRLGNTAQPAAVRTDLGWDLFGILPHCSSTHSINHIVSNVSRDNELNSLIQDYYQLDSVGINQEEKINTEDARAIKIVENTTRRFPNGRFNVRLGKTIGSEHRIQASHRVFWGDSKTVLAWTGVTA